MLTSMPFRRAQPSTCSQPSPVSQPRAQHIVSQCMLDNPTQHWSPDSQPATPRTKLCQLCSLEAHIVTSPHLRLEAHIVTSPHLRLEAHVEHSVGLVQHDVSDAARVGRQHVDHAAGVQTMISAARFSSAICSLIPAGKGGQTRDQTGGQIEGQVVRGSDMLVI